MKKSSVGRVVIVDDEWDVRTSLGGIIKKSGFEAYDFENGNDAITFLRGQDCDVDVILTDIRMPEMGGLELLDKMLEIDDEIPVILMTAFAEIELTVEAIKKGAFDFIIKPYEHEYILRAVEKAVRYRRLRRLEHSYLKELEEALAKQAGELKKANDIVLQNEKMALMGQISAGVAHEINNPVGFISCNLGSLDRYSKRLIDLVKVQSDLIDKYCPKEELEKIKEFRKKIRLDRIVDDVPKLLDESLDGANRIKDIVGNLKGFSREDKGEFILTNINSIIDKTLDIVRNELKYVATVVTDYGEIPPIQCLPNQLTQVFINLLINAAHSIQDQGKISVRTWREGDNAYISISDTGCGIPDDAKKHIFEPFFTTKEVGKGTGLGLSISSDIIRKHFGDISVESTVGEGTIFIVRLPLAYE